MKKNLVIVLFGSTGDLTYRKLMPSLTNLYKNKYIEHNIEVIAVGRRDYDNKKYFDYMLKHNNSLDINTIAKFTKYYKMQITEPDDYLGLKTYIDNISNDNTRIISYMAVAPYFFKEVARNIHKGKIIKKNNTNHSIIFEKPFGNNLKTAKELNKDLWNLFDESQIYRIDNYLAKKIVQHISRLRFEIPIFLKSWNNNNIKDIKIISKESISIVGRGSFYEETGALRDMVQSHLLQLLALITMDKPQESSSTAIKHEKIKVLRALNLNKDNVLLGQYLGYTDEEEVASNSNTETLAFLQVEVNSKNMKDIPIYLFTGKKLDDKQSKIIINFKTNGNDKKIEKLIIEFAPNNKITVKTKISSEDITNSVIINNNSQDSIDDYDKLLYDAIYHDSKLFISGDEVEASWKFIDDVYKLDKKVVIYEEFQDIKNLIPILFEK